MTIATFDVKRKIATFEAHNQEVRKYSYPALQLQQYPSPSRVNSATPKAGGEYNQSPATPSRQDHPTTTSSAASTPSRTPAPSNIVTPIRGDSNLTFPSSPLEATPTFCSSTVIVTPPKELSPQFPRKMIMDSKQQESSVNATSTAIASQNRKSRIRQQARAAASNKIAKNNAAAVKKKSIPNTNTTMSAPSNLMERSLAMKERRMLNKSQNNQTNANSTPTRSTAQSSMSPGQGLSNRINIARKTGYTPSTQSTEIVASKADLMKHSKHIESSKRREPAPATTPVRMNGRTQVQSSPQQEQQSRHSEPTMTSPDRKLVTQVSRMAKIQRMQRMKGQDYSKRGHPQPLEPEPSRAMSPSVNKNFAPDAPGSIDEDNYDNYSRRESPRKHDRSTAKSNKRNHHGQGTSPPVTPQPLYQSALSAHRRDPQQLPPGLDTSPTPNDSSMLQMHSPSPTRSSTDIMSENMMEDPSSIDQANMDDDETLTSVRRIMSRNTENHHHDSFDSPGGQTENSIRKRQQLGDGNSSVSMARPNQPQARGGGRRTGWPHHHEDEKSDKVTPPVIHTGSSSDYDTDDGDISKTSGLSSANHYNSGSSKNKYSGSTSHRSSNSSDSRHSSTRNKLKKHRTTTRTSNDFYPSRQGQSGSTGMGGLDNRLSSRTGSLSSKHRDGLRVNTDDDERTFDYGDPEGDASQASESFAMRRRKDAERQARKQQEREEAAAAAAAAENASARNSMNSQSPRESPLINKNDVEHYSKSIDPVAKTAGGVVAAATIGCIVLGPVGLLVGAAAVGIGVGVMQIPEENRNHLSEKARQAMLDVHNRAVDASETLSHSCAASYNDSGVAEHLPHCLSGSEANKASMDDHESTRSDGQRSNRTGKEDFNMSVNYNQPMSGPPDGGSIAPLSPSQMYGQSRNKKVAFLRHSRIVPVTQIHGLDPEHQPKAWLDVMASAETTDDEKMEAMEEILLLAKDKRRARIFLEEGILDSIMWILSRYLEKATASSKGINTSNWANPAITRNDEAAAKLAAMCCVTLGKAHCAAIHTEGDLLLMSLYERGTVPEERQMAQMLHEVPHHSRVTKTSDPTTIDPAKEVFAVKQMTLPQAEDLARSIKAIADGNFRPR